MENILLINNTDSFIKKFNEILSENNDILSNNINGNNNHNLTKNLINYIRTLPVDEIKNTLYTLSLENIQQIISDSYNNLINKNNHSINETPTINKFTTDIDCTLILVDTVDTKENFLSKIKNILNEKYNDFYNDMCSLSIKCTEVISDPNLLIIRLEWISSHTNDDFLKQSLDIVIYILKFIMLLK